MNMKKYGKARQATDVNIIGAEKRLYMSHN
jgi:hypothetical protein